MLRGAMHGKGKTYESQIEKAPRVQRRSGALIMPRGFLVLGWLLLWFQGDEAAVKVRGHQLKLDGKALLVGPHSPDLNPAVFSTFRLRFFDDEDLM